MATSVSEYGTAEERVARGVVFLDEQFPGWRGYVHAGTLDLTSCEECVLGQLAAKHPKVAGNISSPDYQTMLTYLDKNPEWAKENGFAGLCGPGNGFECGCFKDVPALRDAWITELARA